MRRCLHCDARFGVDARNCPDCGFGPHSIDGFDAYAPELAYEGGGFKSEYFGELARLEENNFWFRSRNQLIMWAMKKYYPAMRSFLEIGCGTGYVLSGVSAGFPNSSIFGSEIFVSGLPFAAARVSHAGFMQMDARKIPFASEFDVVGAFDVLEHIEEDTAVLKQLHQALRPGGGLLITVPQHRWLWSVADDYACHVRRYSSTEIRNKLVAAGFKVECESSFVSLLLPLMVLSRLKKKKVSDYQPLGELKLPRILNSLFMGLMLLELALIKFGVNFPFGGSRMVVARKMDSND